LSPVVVEAFPDVKSFCGRVKGMDLAAIDSRAEAVKLAQDLHRRGLLSLEWMVHAWVCLRDQGCVKSIPKHPFLLLLGFYDDMAAKQKSFRIQRYISQELDERVGEVLLKSVSSDPAVAARTLFKPR